MPCIQVVSRSAPARAVEICGELLGRDTRITHVTGKYVRDMGRGDICELVERRWSRERNNDE